MRYLVVTFAVALAFTCLSLGAAFNDQSFGYSMEGLTAAEMDIRVYSCCPGVEAFTSKNYCSSGSSQWSCGDWEEQDCETGEDRQPCEPYEEYSTCLGIGNCYADVRPKAVDCQGTYTTGICQWGIDPWVDPTPTEPSCYVSSGATFLCTGTYNDVEGC
jgi:hypothetical protein